MGCREWGFRGGCSGFQAVMGKQWGFRGRCSGCQGAVSGDSTMCTQAVGVQGVEAWAVGVQGVGIPRWVLRLLGCREWVLGLLGCREWELHGECSTVRVQAVGARAVGVLAVRFHGECSAVGVQRWVLGLSWGEVQGVGFCSGCLGRLGTGSGGSVVGAQLSRCRQ